MDTKQVLADIDHAMTEIDLALYEWQTATDMMSFIGQDIPMYVYETAPAQMERLTVKRVPLVRYESGERIVIGVADVDQASGVIKAEVHAEHAEILAIPGGSYSIADEDPPVLDHQGIKAQLRALIMSNQLVYNNPYANVIPDNGYGVKMKINGEWRDISPALVSPIDHPFFKETPDAP